MRTSIAVLLLALSTSAFASETCAVYAKKDKSRDVWLATSPAAVEVFKRLGLKEVPRRDGQRLQNSFRCAGQPLSQPAYLTAKKTPLTLRLDRDCQAKWLKELPLKPHKPVHYGSMESGPEFKASDLEPQEKGCR